jgi:hypothetical protein
MNSASHSDGVVDPLNRNALIIEIICRIFNMPLLIIVPNPSLGVNDSRGISLPVHGAFTSVTDQLRPETLANVLSLIVFDQFQCCIFIKEA